MNKHIALALLTLAASAGIGVTAAQAEQAGIQRHEALRHDLDTPGREFIQVRVDFAPHASFGLHTHPGIEVAYVLEGTVTYTFDDQPPVTLKAGQSLYIPAGQVHAAHNPGAANAAELATYLVEKGKPVVVLKPTSP
ncbi:MAG TPA: cupin domain-containing protein [Stenotrophomonas sp.]